MVAQILCLIRILWHACFAGPWAADFTNFRACSELFKNQSTFWCMGWDVQLQKKTTPKPGCCGEALFKPLTLTFILIPVTPKQKNTSGPDLPLATLGGFSWIMGKEFLPQLLQLCLWLLLQEAYVVVGRMSQNYNVPVRTTGKTWPAVS